MYKDYLTSTEYEVIEISPKNLALDKRLDIILKLICIPHILGKESSSSIENLYKEHIRCMTQGTFKEFGSETKLDLLAFKEEFKAICTSISEDGFNENTSLIPVTNNLVPINGAHRIAAALYFGVNIKVVLIPEIKDVNYDISFFRKYHFDERYINSAIIKLFNVSEKYILGVTWPASGILPKHLSELFQNRLIDIRSTILTKEGCHNIVCEAYSKESWLGTAANNFKGAWGKAIPCLGKNKHPANFFILKIAEEDSIVILKDEIRSKIGIGKHSIHICDNNIDSLPLLNYVYNIHFDKIVNTSHYKYKSLLTKIDSFSKNMKHQNIDSSDVLLDGSTLLGALGLREPRDLDYLSLENKSIPFFDKHNDYLKFYNEELIDLFLDQKNHIHIYGFKIISPLAFIEFKKNRNEEKDIIDIKLLSSFEENSNLYFLKAKVSSEFLFFKYKIRKVIIKCIELTGTKKILKKILRR